MQLSNMPAYADRPPLNLIDPTAPSRSLRDDLDRLAHLVDVALRNANLVLETKHVLRQSDSHRDALHLQARLEGLARQVEYAAEALLRIERRDNERAKLIRPNARATRGYSTATATE